MTTTFLIIGATIIAALAAYAGILLAKLHKQQKAQAAALAQAQLKQNKQKQNILNSLLIIARSVSQGQCDISEGSWRICVLIDSNSELLSHQSSSYPAIAELYQGIKHMPILDERKKLAKRERMKLDLERMKLENRLNEQIQQEVITLANFAQDQLASVGAQQ